MDEAKKSVQRVVTSAEELHQTIRQVEQDLERVKISAKPLQRRPSSN
jgi:uncharacterized protein Yka (UPF0111/DUF47 family)